MAEYSGAEQLAQAIVAQADAEANKIREDAKNAARDLVAEAQLQAAKQREEVASAEALRRARQSASALATAHLEARREVLRAREELIDRVFGAVEERLEALRSEPAYGRILVSLVGEAAAALESERELAVDVCAADYEFARQALGTAPINNHRIVVRSDEQISRGGCIVRQSDGRVLYDNTYGSIVARHRRRLRAAVAEMLWESRWEAT